MYNADEAAVADPVDEANDDAPFPASDPPAWTGFHAGPPLASERPEAWLRSVSYRGSVEDGVAQLERALAEAGLTIFARVDHAAEARAVGLAMRPTVLVLFGSPKVGTPLMIARPTAAIDLPLKALVWQSEAGETWLTYNTPALLEQRHGLDPALASSLGPAGDLLERAMRR